MATETLPPQLAVAGTVGGGDDAVEGAGGESNLALMGMEESHTLGEAEGKLHIPLIATGENDALTRTEEHDDSPEEAGGKSSSALVETEEAEDQVDAAPVGAEESNGALQEAEGALNTAPIRTEESNNTVGEAEGESNIALRRDDSNDALASTEDQTDMALAGTEESSEGDAAAGSEKDGPRGSPKGSEGDAAGEAESPVRGDEAAAKGAGTSSMTIKEILAQLDGVFPMDEAVLDALPSGSTFVSVDHFGTSAWTITGKLVARSQDGEEEVYFLKIAYGETGRIMLGGEFESSKAIHATMPDFIPTPYGFGKYKADGPDVYFYLSEFVDMDVSVPPDPDEFTRRLAHLHRTSQSPTGRFGFHVPTCDGDRAHVVDWQDSWAVFFRNLFLGVCERDVRRNGPWPKYERAIRQVAWEVVPRLLEPLQAEGRSIKPCLIHGDLWEGNMGIRLDSGDSTLFDAGSYFAHNEMELGHWRCEFSSVFRARVYQQHYLRHYHPAEPAHQFDDRNRLYSLKGAINYSAGHPNSSLRKTAYNNMCYLCEKYAPTDEIDKYDPELDPAITGATIVPHLADGLI
ncbi:hypothetical protein VTK73DRAFT_1320 [Phialemonium thermophilum]|uniref:protein-ribulosamine 3-kinase n=1 Tax=Phialemonium thermophilum TaxID=223376 RepID=A0ABR3VTN1_9PEZI